MAVNLSPVGGVAAQFLDNNGNVLTGGKIYTYAAGTTTPQASYTNNTGTTAHSNPIILDASGRVPGGEIWLTDGLQYKVAIYTADNVLIGTYDNVIGINSNFVNFVTAEEVQIATAGQTVFTLTTMSYQPGTNNLVVYVDGVNQVEGGSYSFVETNSTTVTFTAGLHVGAVVKFVSAELLSTNVTSASTTTFTGFNSQVGVVQDIADADGSDWIGFEPAGTAAVARSVESKLRETVSVKDFGAVGDGVTDDTAAIQAAINSLGANGGTVYFPVGTYVVSSSISVGDGTNSSISTTCAIRLIGAAGGVGAGSFGPPRNGVQIFWNGATSTTTPVIVFNGPFHSGGIENIVVNCDSKAGIGIQLLHAYQCYFSNVNVVFYTTRGFVLVSRTQQIVGVTQGAMDNTFINCFAISPAFSSTECGLYLDGYDDNNIGCSRNTFINCIFFIAGDPGTMGIYLGFVDNNLFMRVSTLWQSLANQNGVGVYAQASSTNVGFPQDNIFVSGTYLGGYVANGTTGFNQFLGYTLSDFAPLPAWDGKIKVQAVDGQLWGGFTGSAVYMSGYTDPATGLNTTGTNYFPVSGKGSSGVTVSSDVVSLIPTASTIVQFSVYLAIEPFGSGASRTFTLFKNGVATAASVTFSSLEKGKKDWVLNSGIQGFPGDLLEVRSEVSGVAFTSNASFTVIFYPQNNAL